MFYLHKSCLKLKTFSVLGVSSFWRLKPSSVARLKIYFLLTTWVTFLCDILGFLCCGCVCSVILVIASENHYAGFLFIVNKLFLWHDTFHFNGAV